MSDERMTLSELARELTLAAEIDPSRPVEVQIPGARARGVTTVDHFVDVTVIRSEESS